LEIRAEQVLPTSEGGWGERKRVEGEKKSRGTGERNGPNNVCTYE
jgi:hypothetical protein